MIAPLAALSALLLAAAPAPGSGSGTTTCVAGSTGGLGLGAPDAGSLRVLARVPSDSLRALWEAGRTFADFHAAAERRRELWDATWEAGAATDEALVERARAVPGTWRLLAVTIDGCSDSVSILPWLARLAERADNLDLRLVDPDVGRAVMEAHPTPDGRAATPTVLLLDEEFNAAGCFIERPRALREWLVENDVPERQVYSRKMAWYEEDAGRSSVEEVVEMLEAAARGEVACGG